MQNSRHKEAPKKKASQWTILDLLQWTTPYFQSHEIDSPRVAAEILLAHVLGLRRIDLYLRYDQPLGAEELAKYKDLIKRRVKREPVAYIVGTKEFWSMEFAVDRHVLIPRPETECVVEQALSKLAEEPIQGSGMVLELGTGSGAIVLALASERARYEFLALDRSVEAVAVARQNAVKLGLSDRVRFIVGDWFLPMGKPIQPADNKFVGFEMIISNPPYIPTETIGELEPEIHLFEPAGALDGGKDGLHCLKEIIQQAPDYLRPGGTLVLEIGHDQKDAIEMIGKKTGKYEWIDIIKDYGGYDRVAILKRSDSGSFDHD